MPEQGVTRESKEPVRREENEAILGHFDYCPSKGRTINTRQYFASRTLRPFFNPLKIIRYIWVYIAQGHLLPSHNSNDVSSESISPRPVRRPHLGVKGLASWRWTVVQSATVREWTLDSFCAVKALTHSVLDIEKGNKEYERASERGRSKIIKGSACFLYFLARSNALTEFPRGRKIATLPRHYEPKVLLYTHIRMRRDGRGRITHWGKRTRFSLSFAEIPKFWMFFSSLLRLDLVIKKKFKQVQN